MDDESYVEASGMILWEGIGGILYRDIEEAQRAYDRLTEGMSDQDIRKSKISLEILDELQMLELQWEKSISQIL